MKIMKNKYKKAITAFTILTILLTGCGNTTKGNKSADQAPNQNQTQSNSEEKTHFYYNANESGSVSK
ncbi:hypothetical protein ACN077_05760 [Clostridium chromiireducens]|uniref:hypothetical protein n=1 Tax=Clostridium chromiireducens TaxID=225345 RepID=UPI003AF87606